MTLYEFIGDVREKVEDAIDYRPCEVSYWIGDTQVGYWAYGSFDPSGIYQGVDIDIDFTSPEGFKLLTDKMTEKGEWHVFGQFCANELRDGWFSDVDIAYALCDFHELTDLTEKVRLLSEYIETLEED